MRTRGEDGRLQAKERGLKRTRLGRHLSPQLAASSTVRPQMAVTEAISRGDSVRPLQTKSLLFLFISLFL